MTEEPLFHGEKTGLESSKSLAATEFILVPAADGKFIEDGNVFAVRTERIDGLLGMVCVLGLAAVLDHRRSNARIDEFLDPQHVWTTTVWLTEQAFDERQIAVRLRDVDDVIQIVVPVNVAPLELYAAVVPRLRIRVHRVQRSRERLHLGPTLFGSLCLGRLERLRMSGRVHH